MAHDKSRNPLSRLFSGGKPDGPAKTGGAGGESPKRELSPGALQEEIARLRRSVETLSILNDLSMAMGSSADPEEMIQKLVDRAMRAVDAEQATVTLVGADQAAEAKTQIRVFKSSAAHQSLRVNDMLLGWMFNNKQPLLIADPSTDSRFKNLEWDDHIRNVMVVPLMRQSKLTGILTTFNKRGDGAFDQEDARLASIIAAQSAQIMDNARLAGENLRMQEQLNLALEIQRTLLPDAPPRIDGYDIAGKSIPAQTVGGDTFDFIEIDDARCAICLGDVSGKGLPASLIMTNAQATLRSVTLNDQTPGRRIAVANNLMCRSTADDRFVTLFYGVLDSATHELVYCSAGHEQPFLVSADGAMRRLEMGGLALGVFENMTYEQETVALKPGDVVVVFSDGVPDATNAADEEFTAKRLEAVLAENRDKPAAALVDAIIDAVNAHAGNAPQFDDLTVVVVKRT
jgi:serine phosphatase RsbU (regulator of sigma subunit)